MARPKRMSARVAFYVPPGVKELVDEIKRLRTERHGGLEAREADIYREAVVRGLPLVLAAEKGQPATSPVVAVDRGGGDAVADGLRVPGKPRPVRWDDLGGTMAHFRKSNRLTPARAGAQFSPEMSGEDWSAIEEVRRRPSQKEAEQLVELLFGPVE